MADALVIKCDVKMQPEPLEAFRKSIIEQRKSGVVVLPSYCEVIVVPEDVHIKMEETVK